MYVGLLSLSSVIATPWTMAPQSSLSFTVAWSLFTLISMSQWCHPTISPSATPFSSCPQSFPASGSFSVSCPFVSGGWNMRASVSASVLPMNSQGWSPLVLTGLIFLQSKGLWRIFYTTTVQKHLKQIKMVLKFFIDQDYYNIFLKKATLKKYSWNFLRNFKTYTILRYCK